MFEAAISPAVANPEASGALRPLDWGELVARLAAPRELRGEFLGGASFGARAERGLERTANGEPDVNLAALGGGKTPMAITVATVEEAAVGDQGTR